MRSRVAQAFFVFAIVLAGTAQTCRLNPNINDCTPNEDVVPVLINHVQYTRYLKIVSLVSNRNTGFSSPFLSSLIETLSNVKKPVIMKTLYFNEPFDKKDILFNTNTIIIKRENETCLNIEKYKTSFDRGRTVLIFTKSVEVLNEYFKRFKNYHHAKRNLHIIFLLSQSQNIIHDTSVLKMLWEKNTLLNVILYMPCSTLISNNIYIYRPFRNDNNYGIIQKYKLSYVKKCSSLLFNNVKNLNRIPLRISIFPRKISAFKDPPNLLKNYKIYENIETTSKMYGSDGILTSEISIAMNFTVKIIMKSQHFGYMLPNYTVTGSAGEVARAEVELQGNTRFLERKLHSCDVEFTTYFDQDRLCVIVKEAPRILEWKTPFLEITVDSWILIVVYVAFSVIVNNILKFPHNKNMSLSFLEVFGVTFSQALTRTSIRGRRGRLFFLCCILCGTVNISCWFAGTLYKSFSKVSYYPNIMTLEELDQHNITMPTSLYAFKGSPRELYQRLDKKARENINKSDALQWVASSYHHAALERHSDTNILLKTRYLKEDGSPMLHVIPECPCNYFLSIIVPKGSPYILEINLILRRLHEGGFNLKWYNDFAWAMIAEHHMKTTDNHNVAKPMDLFNIIFAFYALLIGYVLSTVVLLGELLIGKKKAYFLIYNH